MHSMNMHNEDDTADMEWLVTCANPIVPAHWDLEYDSYIYEGDAWEVNLY